MIKVDCPECGGEGGFDDIGCCGYPLEDGSCCGNGVKIETPCRWCCGTGYVEVEPDEKDISADLRTLLSKPHAI